MTRALKQKFTAVAAAILMFTLAGGASSGSAPQNWEDTVAAAKKEGKLTIYGSADYELLFKEFEKKYPEIDVTGFYSRGRNVIKRLMSERRADKHLADVFLNGVWTAFRVLYKRNVLEPLGPALMLPEVVDSSKWWRGELGFVDEEKKYLLAFNGIPFLTLYYNTKLVNPGDINSYRDFLDLKWKGKMIAFDPRLGPAGPPISFMYHSPDLGPEFIQQLLGGMDVPLTRNDKKMVDWLGVGKYAIAMFSPIRRAGMDVAKKQGLPVDWFGPNNFKEGVPLSAGSGGVGLMRNAPHPNAARVALNWLLSREGQIAYQKIFVGVNSRRIDIPKDDLPSYVKRSEGANYVVTETPAMIDTKPVRALIDKIYGSKGKGSY